MKRSEAFWVLNEMYELANEAQRQALAIAQRDIEFVDLMQDVPVQRWIPVTERLPEKNTAVIAVTDNGIVFQCLYAYDGWDLWEGNEVHITHWMPLPEPPKEDAE